MAIPTSPPQVPDSSIPFDTPEGTATWNDYFVRLNLYLLSLKPAAGAPVPVTANQFPTPYDFGAIGSGVADDFLPLQQWFDYIPGHGGVGFLPKGIFATTRVVQPSGGTTIWGSGLDGIIKTMPGIAQDYPLLVNKNIVSSGDARIDIGIKFFNCSFQGSPGAAVHDFIDFIGVDDLTFQHCAVSGRERDLVVLANCINYHVDFNHLYNFAQNPPVAPGWAGGNAVFCLTPCYNGTITYNQIANGGIGIWMPASPGYGCTVQGNMIQTVQEAGIVGSPPLSNISGNMIVNVTRVDVSGHGCEMQGNNYSFYGNQIQLCDATCAFFGNITNVQITGNNFNLPNQLGEVINGALTISALPPEAGEGSASPNNVTITGNQMSGRDGNGRNAILFGNLTAAIITNVDQGIPAFLVIGDKTTEYLASDILTVTGFPANNGNYTVVSSSYNSGLNITTIVVVEPIPDPTAAGVTYSSRRLLTNIQVSNNNYGPPGGWVTGSGPFMAQPATGFYPEESVVAGADFIHRNNNGDADAEPCSINFLITGASPSRLTIGGVPFKPRRIEFDAVAVLSPGESAASHGFVGYAVGWDTTTNSISLPYALANGVTGWSTNGLNQQSTGTGLACIYLVNANALAAGYCVAVIASADDLLADGFVLTLSIPPSGTNIVYATCYP